jgi:hypothetical protein
MDNEIDNVDEIVDELNIYGYSKIKLFDKNDEILKGLKKIHYLGENSNLPGRIDEYQGGFAKFFTADDIHNSYFEGINYFEKWLSNKTITLVIEKLSKYKKYKLDHMYQTLDTNESKHIAQDPHFDRIPTLKFMLYLNDMNEKNGAFILSPGSNNWVANNFNKRGKFDDKEFFQKTRKIPKPIIKRLISLNGDEGTLIIFHTDCIHMQGIVNQKESRIFRVGYRFNSDNKLKRFARTIKSKFKKN